MTYSIKAVSSEPFDGQKPGTSGLRKPTETFIHPHYTENFVQSILSAALGDKLGRESVRLVLGGDGRFFVRECLTRVIIPICAANGVNEVLVGQNGLLSTPAASCMIRRHRCSGGILLTASHNPGGENADFGIKYNCENGGPAPERVTDSIFHATKQCITYFTLDQPLAIDLAQLGLHEFHLANGSVFKVNIIGSTDDYVQHMSQLFDFPSIRSLLTSGSFKLIANGMNGVMGPYIRRVLCEELGLPEGQTVKCEPLEDFGGHHPDPNLTYAADLVDTLRKDESIDMGCAFDGDGDRNMIIGRAGFFVSPCDSLAVIADQAKSVKYFKENGLSGFARSMPTSRALDKVCEANGIPCYEVPTGWKFFGNLMDAKLCCLCGEESFGTGSDHIREKDGMWAVLAWLSILADRRSRGLSCDLQQVLHDHWRKFGRHFFTRYDFEDCTAEQGQKMMAALQQFIGDPKVKERDVGGLRVLSCDNYCYTDPVDKSVSANQGVRIFLDNGARLVYRLSGTGSSGATLRLYIDCYEREEQRICQASQDYLRKLIDLALDIGAVEAVTGRRQPTVIT